MLIKISGGFQKVSEGFYEGSVNLLNALDSCGKGGTLGSTGERVKKAVMHD